jgi:hypothetical protein
VTPAETVALARYVRALCPQQKFDEYTPDAWHDVLGAYQLDDARAAAAAVAGRQPFVAPAEIITEIRRRRGDTASDIVGPGQPAEIPDADPDDIPAYLAAVRDQRTRAATGQLKPRPMRALLTSVGRGVPGTDRPVRGPLDVACPKCESAPRRACRTPNGRRMAVIHPARIDALKTRRAEESA